MKKIISIIFAVSLVFLMGTSVYAAGGAVTELDVKADASSVTFSGKTTALAVMADVYDAENSLIAEKSFAVKNNVFEGIFNDLELTEGVKYTLKVADYDGGEWTSEEFSVAVEKKVMPFKDVTDKDAYYYDAVAWGYENDIVKGVSDTLFAPGKYSTRGQMVTFLWRAAGCPQPEKAAPFADVKDKDYYAKAVAWAFEQGITYGVSKKSFAPDEYVTRGQVVAFLYRFDGSEKVAADKYFTDINAGSYYYDAVLWAYSNGITFGTDEKTFSPDSFCYRCQVVTFLYRYFNAN